jgi:hypothetical protein
MGTPVDAGGNFATVDFIAAFRASYPLFVGEDFHISAASGTLNQFYSKISHILSGALHISPPEIHLTTL